MSKEKHKKTNALRILDTHKIPYSISEYEWSVELVHVKDLLSITGYLRGGCSPVGMKKAFPTYFDATMEPQKFVYVSAGLRGMQMKVNPKDLASVVNAEFVELTMDH